MRFALYLVVLVCMAMAGGEVVTAAQDAAGKVEAAQVETVGMFPAEGVS